MAIKCETTFKREGIQDTLKLSFCLGAAAHTSKVDQLGLGSESGLGAALTGNVDQCFLLHRCD